MKPEIDYTLYLVTDRECMNARTVEDSVELAIRGGCTLVQLREKGISSLEFYETAKKVRVITKQYDVPFIINDRVDIALAVDADGVHVGQSDLPAKMVRRIMGEHKIVGVSASNLEEALTARDDGADYLGVGAMFSTATKADANITSMETLARIRKEVELPIVVIGGINRKTAPGFAGAGIQGLAVVSAIVAQTDIERAARELKTLFVQGESGC